MSKRGNYRDLLKVLADKGLLEYGSVIPRELVHQVIGVRMPEIGTKAQFDAVALAEISAIDYCRNYLLGHGKYLGGTPTGYQIWLPSDNRKQIDLYMESANRKLSRALKLSRNSPSMANTQPDQLEARIHLKMQNTRHQVGSSLRA